LPAATGTAVNPKSGGTAQALRRTVLSTFWAIDAMTDNHGVL
jgi:hypothetical protein